MAWVETQRERRQSDQGVRSAGVIRNCRDSGWLVYCDEVVGSRKHGYWRAVLYGNGSGDLDDVAFTNRLVVAQNALAPHENAAIDDGLGVRAGVREHVADRAARARGNDVALRGLHGVESLSHAFHDAAVPVDS